MVDFKKKLKEGKVETKTNPIEIYESLDRMSETGPLRPAQYSVLTDWFENRRNSKNLIIKLHTGQGKTLIGLLILQSKLNSKDGPCLYLCPNKYLVEQTIIEAKKFGIPYCLIGEDRGLPDEFINGEKILVTTVQRLFNGKSKFGLDNKSQKIGTIILDDSHACIDSINSSFTIKVEKTEPLFDDLLSLFEADLINQGEGSLLDIKLSKYDTILPIPYWSWIDKKTEVLKLFSENLEQNISLQFAWPLIKDKITNCNAIISGHSIEIFPYYIPMHHFGSFHNAEQRILMSATTQDDSFFIKGFGFDKKSIEKPLVDVTHKWSGEKMLLLPSIIDDSLTKTDILKEFITHKRKQYGYVALVPSFRYAEEYEHLGAKLIDNEIIFKAINELKKGDFSELFVLANRYDGIDMPDDSCRVLFIDSKPFFSSHKDRYEEMCRPLSDTINTKIAQKIEQGLGRSVRGEKDYSVIILLGGDLVKFIKSSNSKKYFSDQTLMQIEIGLEIAESAKDDLKSESNPLKVLLALVNQSIQRDNDWKEFYRERMDEIKANFKSNDLLDVLILEEDAENANYREDYLTAMQKMQTILDKYTTLDSERGWYLQELARYNYHLSKVDSISTQKSAFKHNYQLMHPKDGITYKKLAYINENRISKIKNFISQQKSYEELMLSIDNTLDSLSFGIPSEKFENALQELGLSLGFLSQRPDKEYKKGPDNLWCGIEDKYIFFECKSEVSDSRNEINKHEAGQMNSHCGWFEQIYGDKNVVRLMIIPTRNLTYQSNFTHEVKIMRKGKLKKLRDNVRNFFKEFSKYNIHELTNDKIQEFLDSHYLNIDQIMTEYSEDYYHNKKN